MAAGDYLGQYAEGWTKGDAQIISGSLADSYQTRDLSIVTICYDFADRVRSYQLVAEVCGLKPA